MFVLRDLINYLIVKETFHIRKRQRRLLEAFTESWSFDSFLLTVVISNMKIHCGFGMMSLSCAFYILLEVCKNIYQCQF